MTKRARLSVIVALVALLVAVAAVILRTNDDNDSASTTNSTTSSSTTATSTSSSSTSASTATSTTAGAVPGRVTGAAAAPGGGSGEVTLRWNATAGATGYRVMRAASASGPFTKMATIDVVNGSTTVADGVVNVVSAAHTYFPAGTALTAKDTSPSFEYVDVASGERFFQVIAFNAAGDGPPSAVVSGAPK